MLSRQALQYFLIFINVLFFIIGGVTLGIGIWLAVDKIFISDIIGTDLFNAGAYLMIICGGVLLFVSVWGAFSSMKNKRVYIMIYFVSVLIIFVLLVGAGIMAAAFQGEIKSTMLSSMKVTLQQYYGRDDSHSQRVTRSWDRTQTLLRCCAVEDRGYRIYRDSWYYQRQIQQGIQRGQLQYIPVSCCVYTEQYNAYINQNTCQTATHMAPGSNIDTGNNPAMYYSGCYNKAMDFVSGNAGILIGMGFAFAALMICGMVFAIMMYRRITHDFTPANPKRNLGQLPYVDALVDGMPVSEKEKDSPSRAAPY